MPPRPYVELRAWLHPAFDRRRILGTNSLEVTLFFVADLAYRGGPILATADRSAFPAGSMGLVVTCVLLLGLLERRHRTVLGMGVDSLAILVVYATGLTGLYYIR